MFVLADGSVPIFRELLKTLKDAIADEIPLTIYEDQLEIRAMDASRVKMAHFVLPKQIFEEWHVTNKTQYKSQQLPVSITVPLDNMIYAIEESGKDAKATFEVTAIFEAMSRPVKRTVTKPDLCPKCGYSIYNNRLPPEKRKVKVTKRGKTERYKCANCGWRGKVRTWTRMERETEIEYSRDSELTIGVVERTKDKYDLKLLEPAEQEDLPIPKLSYKGRFKVVAKEFKAKLERLRKKADSVKLVGSEEGIALQGTADLIDAETKIGKGSDILLVAESPEPQTARFSLDQLISIVPKNTVAQIAGLEYSTNMPMRVTWFTSFGEATIEFYIAPRIECEE